MPQLIIGDFVLWRPKGERVEPAVKEDPYQIRIDWDEPYVLKAEDLLNFDGSPQYPVKHKNQAAA